MCRFLLAAYIQQSKGSVNSVDYHKTPVLPFIHTTRASPFCKGKQGFSVDKIEIKLCKEAAVELSISANDLPINLSEKVVKMSEQRA